MPQSHDLGEDTGRALAVAARAALRGQSMQRFLSAEVTGQGGLSACGNKGTRALESAKHGQLPLRGRGDSSATAL